MYTFFQNKINEYSDLFLKYPRNIWILFLHLFWKIASVHFNQQRKILVLLNGKKIRSFRNGQMINDKTDIERTNVLLTQTLAQKRFYVIFIYFYVSFWNIIQDIQWPFWWSKILYFFLNNTGRKFKKKNIIQIITFCLLLYLLIKSKHLMIRINISSFSTSI